MSNGSNNFIPTLPKDIFELVKKPEDTSYKSGWVYETVTLRLVRTDEIFIYEGISHTKTWSSTHKRRNELFRWAEKASIGDTCCLHYEALENGILDKVSLTDEKTIKEAETENNMYKVIRTSIRELLTSQFYDELAKEDAKDGKLHKHIRKCTAAVTDTVKRAIDINTDNADYKYYNKIKEMIFFINPETQEFELYIDRDFDIDKTIKFHNENPNLYSMHDSYSNLLSEWLKGNKYLRNGRKIFNIRQNGIDGEKTENLVLAKNSEHITLLSDYKVCAEFLIN